MNKKLLAIFITIPLAGFFISQINFSGLNVSEAAGIVNISSGQNIQTVVDANPAGTVYQLSSGVFRMQSVVPKVGDVFKGTLGANNTRLTTMSGARQLTVFTREGNYWVASGQTQQGQIHPDSTVCVSGYTRCGYPEDLFINNIPLTHVGTLGQVTIDTYFFDYNNDKIYFLTDPTSKVVETSVARVAFSGSAGSVTIQDMVVEKYAIPAQMGAIGDQFAQGTGWTILNNEIRWNHGAGLRLSTNAKALSNSIHDNGQLGIGGNGSNILFEGNEVYNNGYYSGVDWGWEGGGFKFAATDHLVIRNNYSHNNKGPGMWTDIDNTNVLYENNTVTDNTGPGIYHEISYSAIIRNNKIFRNATIRSGWIWDAGVVISASQDVEIYGNDIRDNPSGVSLVQQNRSGPNGAYLVKNVSVHDNTIVVMRNGSNDNLSGAVQDTGDVSVFTNRNNHFTSNIYYLGSNTNYFTWSNLDLNDQGWKNSGNDVNGQFFHGVTPPAAVSIWPALVGDINFDCIVNTIDFSIMNSRWLTADSAADLNHDGIINTIDFSLMNANWFRGC